MIEDVGNLVVSIPATSGGPQCGEQPTGIVPECWSRATIR